MFDQIPKGPRYHNDPSGQPQTRDYRTMLAALNIVVHRAAIFNKAKLKVDVPIAYNLEWPMGTPAGNAVFRHPKVNAQLRKILSESDKDTGWFGPAAMAAMPNFDSDFICAPAAPYHGFTSGDDYFTRQYRPNVRPIAFPQDHGYIINACEAAPSRLAYDIKAHGHFWLKEQPYSLEHMLASDALAPQFIGGIIYQANLRSLNYHRWHSPVAGTIAKAYAVPGAYCAENLAKHFDATEPDDSLAYINTRAIVFMKAEDTDIGLICFLAMGLCEVGSCGITVCKGQRVKKGDQLGTFHLGGSTYCLLFRPEAHMDFDLHGDVPGLEARNIPSNAATATVTRHS